jgi:DNA helicase HerA-like ATPase
VNQSFLAEFYEYSPDSSIHLGNLVGYEHGENVVPVYIDIDRIVTEHLAVLAMTGAGKSYTVGRIIERMLTQVSASIVVFDPHGEYGAALRGGELNFNREEHLRDAPDRESLEDIRQTLLRLQPEGGGLHVYVPHDPEHFHRYNGAATGLALQLDSLDVDDLQEILPDITEPQQRVLGVAIRYWLDTTSAPRDVNDLLLLLTERLDTLRHWDQLYAAERKALNDRSASIVSLRLRRLINEARSFYERGRTPLDVRRMVGRLKSSDLHDGFGRIAIVDLQGLSKTAMQAIVALICNEILKAAGDKADPICPVFLVVEEGHTFAPAREASIAKPIIKRIAAEGRKFGVGLGIISQRPSKLDPDVTSQCNTIVTMRIKNPDDQRFIRSSSDYFSEMDIQELPALSTGEALVTGRAILAPLIVKVGTKVLTHGGEAPQVSSTWRARSK